MSWFANPRVQEALRQIAIAVLIALLGLLGYHQAVVQPHLRALEADLALALSLPPRPTLSTRMVARTEKLVLEPEGTLVLPVWSSAALTTTAQTAGSVVWDSTAGALKVFTGTQWVALDWTD